MRKKHDYQNNPFVRADDPRHDFYPYETVDYTARLEVLDKNWTTARYTRRQRIRFLDDGVGTFFDRVWGDGVLFANYHAEGMRLVDAIPTRNGYIVVLQLPRLFHKHAEFEIVTERKIVGAFFQEPFHWESSLQLPVGPFSLDVVAPRASSFRDADVWAPPGQDLDASVHGRTLKFRVKQPAAHVPYKVSWLPK